MENFRIEQNNNIIDGVLTIDNINVCKCRMYHNNNTWTISSWYTLKDFLHQGYGKKTLNLTVQEMAKLYGVPEKIEYIWNGANEYVYNWLNENFGAVSKCPIAIQKYANDDDWDSHIYTLNREKFLNYFNINNLAIAESNEVLER